MSAVPADELGELLVEAWYCMAPKALQRDYDAAQ
jgi:hypothetical protein